MRDWDDDELDDEEHDDDVDEPEDDEDEPTVPCPYCRRQIHEDAQRCPYCERYISEEDAPTRPKPWWLWVGVIVCLLIALRWILG
jgi:hypothetical protein